MRWLKVVALLHVLFVSCNGGDGAAKTTPPPPPIRLLADAIDSWALQLDPMVNPVVLVLLRGEDEAQIQALSERMGRIGYSRFGTNPVEGATELRFFARPTAVLETNVDEVVWHANSALWIDGVPFEWAFGMARGLHVPTAFADRARATLSRDPIAAPRVIERDGTLAQDRISREKAAAKPK